jgi:hypothetical protein
MHCSSCGTQLPLGVAYCPGCGAVTPYRVSESDVAPDDPTSASFPPDTPYQRSPTDHGTPLYEVSQQNPYDPLNPYEVPPPPPPPRRRVKFSIFIGVFSGVVAAIIILASVAVFALLAQRAKDNTSRNAPSSSTVTVQTNLTTTSTPLATTATSTGNLETNPYHPFKGTLVLDDPLHDNSKGYGWDVYPVNTDGAACEFANDGYHVIEQKSYITACFPTIQLSHFTFEVQMKVIKGDCGGLTFDDTTKTAYHFEVCQDGTYSLFRYDSPTSSPTLVSGSSPAIKSGLNQSNLIAIVAVDNTFDLYVNRQRINGASDSTYHQGLIGLRASYNGSVVEVVYSNAKAWML